MEYLNRIELRGLVGSSTVSSYEGKKVARITLVTKLAYTERDGTAVIDSQWHNVTAWEGRNVQNLDAVAKGSKIYVCGRARTRQYTSVDGEEKSISDVLAHKLVIVEDEEPLAVEM